MRPLRFSIGSFGVLALLCESAYPEPDAPKAAPEQKAAKSHPENLVVNGSFETRQTGEPPVNIETFQPGNSELAAWEIIDSPPLEGQADRGPPRTIDWIGPTRWRASHGNYCLDLDGGVRQTIATVKGADYELRFDFAGNPELGNARRHLRVLIDDRREEFHFQNDAARTDNMLWVTKSVRFAATSEKTTLTFKNAAPNAQSAGVALDRVEVIPAAQEPSATIEGTAIRLKPSGVTFKIPEAWLAWHAGFKNNLHLTRAELEKVKAAEGDWDKEFSEIANELLPFASCAAHVGSEGWGREGVSYGDLQLRAYVLDSNAEKVQARLMKHGAEWASRYSKEITLAQSEHEGWRKASLTYALWYGDYGGKALVDVYARDFGTQTAVLVFLHTDFVPGGSAWIPEILKSFAWAPSAS